MHATWFAAESSALAPDAHQSSQSLCRSGHAACASETPAAAPALEWPGKETRRDAEERNEDRLEALAAASAQRCSRTPHVRRRG